MPSYDMESEYQTKYRSSSIMTAPDAGTDLVSVEFDQESQLSHLHLSAGEMNNFLLIVRDQNGANSSTVATFSNVSELNIGTFEDPVHKAGAQREYVVQNDDAGSSDTDYSVNVRVDEHTG